MAEATLYERLGGVFAIAAVINHFSDAVVQNRAVGRGSDNPALNEWHTNELSRLPGLKFMRTLWVCDVAGGPFTFTATARAAPTSGWRKPIAICASHLMSSTRSRPNSDAASTPSRCRSARRTKCWPRSPHTRAR